MSEGPPQQQRYRADLFTSPLFVVALTALVSNDWLFKQLFPSAITGKLSDVAGLLAFTLFWLAVFPRHSSVVALVVAAAFTAWKHPLAQPGIDIWNTHAPFSIGRTPDLTDLAALAVIPVAAIYASRVASRPIKRLPTMLLILASAVAFAATSYRTTFEYTSEYVYSGTPAEFATALGKRGITAYPQTDAPVGLETQYWLRIPATICFESIEASLAVAAYDNTTRVRLMRLTHRCPEKHRDKALLYRIFNEAVVEPLKMGRAA